MDNERQGRIDAMEERVFATARDILLPRMREGKGLTEKDVSSAIQNAVLLVVLYEGGRRNVMKSCQEYLEKLQGFVRERAAGK